MRYNPDFWLKDCTGRFQPLTSDTFFHNSLILLISGIKKALHRPFSERCLNTVSNGGLLQPLVRPVLRVRSGGIWSLVPGQANASQNTICIGGHWAWQSVRLCPCGEESTTAQHSIPFGCRPDSSGGRASSNACAGAAGSRTPYNRSRYEPGPSVVSSDRWAGS